MKRLLFAAVTLFAVIFVSAQNTFEKRYGTLNFEEIWESKILSDSTIVHAGYTNINNGYLVKTKLNGDTIWTREIKDPAFDILYSVDETLDKAIITVGRSSSFGAGALDIYLLKINKNGIPLWRKAIGGSGDETANEIKKTSDKGFIIVGNTYSFGAGGNDFYIVKIDSVGTILWTKTIGANLNDNAYSVIEAYNKDIVVTGLTTENPGPGNNVDVLIARLDKNGNIKWTNKYGHSAGDDRGQSIVENSNKELVVTGLYNTTEVLFLKTDSLGNVLTSKSYNTGAFECGYSIKNTKDNNFLICGHQSVPAFGYDYLFMKVDPSGDTLWLKNYGDANSQFGTNIEECFDKSIFITGRSLISGSDYDYCILRTDSMGKTACTNRNASVAIVNLSLTAMAKTYTISSGGILNVGTQTATSSGSITILCQSSSTVSTGLSKTNNTASILVYPNPSSETLSIDLPNIEEYHLEIYNTIGQKIYSTDINKNNNLINVSNYPKGLHVIHLQNKDGLKHIHKIIIE